MEPWEPVHTVDDWYDGPRGGVADHGGRPHHYRSLYLDNERWNADEDRFELTPVSADAVGWTQECGNILRRYYAAYHAGTAPDDPDDERVLPEDRARRDELEQKFSAELTANKYRTFVVRGEFELGCKRVKWRPVESGGQAEPKANSQ
jgi:hypothetical protein